MLPQTSKGEKGAEFKAHSESFNSLMHHSGTGGRGTIPHSMSTPGFGFYPRPSAQGCLYGRWSWKTEVASASRADSKSVFLTGVT